ncbi:MAG: hypothetical protein KZQ66_03515 [Candidatus Thiodiazotropha sp. (ex Lucinoma aequizonata)]|nr:hypothetical protein [Candidatus Thiodiazotropha sp. (ex Lucinoma aequizonata)]MCU7889800.1 hypothetical protein [Candidatus Thiodiazotropha sp. (ex Lucinoma aequizonata)]MCU7901186.1 hypothetical protein [Candidatus Thiodiazotropha sp. (ex Lucinoma aequizonata)]MCU7908765.1 hypothetical protein [Candidatus Thiodiazotropha sp. (ex Lucinoma aequizonata)]
MKDFWTSQSTKVVLELSAKCRERYCHGNDERRTRHVVIHFCNHSSLSMPSLKMAWAAKTTPPKNITDSTFKTLALKTSA